MININLMGVVRGVKAFVPLLKRHGEGGCIVNTGYLSQRRKPAAKAFACLLVANPEITTCPAVIGENARLPLLESLEAKQVTIRIAQHCA